MKKYFYTLLKFLILALLLTACANFNTATPSANSTSLPETQPEATSSQAISLTDALGRQIVLDAPPSRVVIAGKATSLLVDALYLFPQANSRLVALTKSSQSRDFLGIIDPKIEDKSTLEGQANTEQIAATHPDIVILKSYMAEKLGKPIEALGIPVLYLNLETPEDYLNELHTLGMLFGDETRANQIVAYYQEQLENIQSRIGTDSQGTQPTVLLMQHTVKGGQTAYLVPPSSWMQTRIVEIAGGSPVWKSENSGGWRVITLEQIAQWNPDQIYIIDYFDNPETAVESFLEETSVHALKAAQNNHVYAFPKDTNSWDQPDTRWILGTLWLAKHIHPQQFQDVDMIEAVRTFYQTLYRLDEETINQELLPRLSGSIP